MKKIKNLIPQGGFDLKQAKVRISLVLNGDILQAYKQAAQNTSHGEYQTLMKEKLREAIFGKQLDPVLTQALKQMIIEEVKKHAS